MLVSCFAMAWCTPEHVIDGATLFFLVRLPSSSMVIHIPIKSLSIYLQNGILTLSVATTKPFVVSLVYIFLVLGGSF